MAKVTDREVPVEELYRDPDEPVPAEETPAKAAKGGKGKGRSKSSEKK